MTAPHLICQYCSHRADAAASVCGHCGAPLPASAPAPAPTQAPPSWLPPATAQSPMGHIASEVEKFVPEVKKLGPEAEKLAPAAVQTLGILSGFAPQLTAKLGNWQSIAAVIGMLVMLAFTFLHSCSFPKLPWNHKATPVQALPSILRTTASCAPYDANGADKCVVEPGSPVLLGGITGGQALTFYVQLDPPDRLAATIARWRSAGGTVLSDGTVFLEIGPSETVWYADTHTGFHLETGTFVSQAGARAFLVRTGLAL